MENNHKIEDEMHVDGCNTQYQYITDDESVKILSCSILHGHNLFHRDTVIRQVVDIGNLKDIVSNKLGVNFAQQFINRFYSEKERMPLDCKNEEFINQLFSDEGASFKDILLEGVLNIEALMAYTMHTFNPIQYSKVFDDEPSSNVSLVWETRNPVISRRAFQVAFIGIIELLPKYIYLRRKRSDEDFNTKLAALKARASKQKLSTTTSVIMLSAKKRNIPYESLGGAHLRLGQGKAQKLIYASVTDDTSHRATQLCRNKRKASKMLHQFGFPVPRQYKANKVEEALLAAKRIGMPVVVKPKNGKQAAGVTVGIVNYSDIPKAYERASQSSSEVIVESFVKGTVHRLLIIYGKFVAALKIIPPEITGDGENNIEALIEKLNSDPKRNDILLFKVEINKELLSHLASMGYQLDSVLQKNKTITLHSAANVAIGGEHIDVTDIVHHDNKQLAIDAANSMGLSIAGIDFITRDINKSYKKGGGSIIEINSRPGFCMHAFPKQGEPRFVANAMLDAVYPKSKSARVPATVIIGSHKTNMVARELDCILREANMYTGLLTKKRAYKNGEFYDIHKLRTHQALKNMLRNPHVESIIRAQSIRDVVRRGLFFDKVDVSAITDENVTSSFDSYNIGLDIVAKATNGTIVVDVSNKAAINALRSLNKNQLILISINNEHPETDIHLSENEIVIVLVNECGRNYIVIRRCKDIIARISVNEKVVENSDGLQRIRSRMFAIGLAYGHGIKRSLIERMAI